MKFVEKLLALVLATSVLPTCAQPRPIPRGTDTSFYGYISAGARFGVSIGDTREVAHGALVGQGFSFSGTTDCGETSLQYELGCERGATFDIYDKHQGLGHDTVFLEVREERIAMIGWSRVLFQIDS